jgi:hypothetical protein
MCPIKLVLQTIELTTVSLRTVAQEDLVILPLERVLCMTVRMMFCVLLGKIVGLLEMVYLLQRIDAGILIVRFPPRIPVLLSTETMISGQAGLEIVVAPLCLLETIDIMIVTEIVIETGTATAENGKGNDDRTTDSVIIG